MRAPSRDAGAPTRPDEFSPDFVVRNFEDRHGSAEANRVHEPSPAGSRRRLRTFGLDLGQHPAEPRKLLLGQEPLPPLLLVRLYEAAGISAVRAQASGFYEIEHLREHTQRTVGLVGCLAQAMMQLGYIAYDGQGETYILWPSEDDGDSVENPGQYVRLTGR